MHCDGCQERLIDLLYGELSASEAAEVREHLAACVDCAQAYAQLQATLDFVDRLPLEAPSPQVDEAILAAAKKKVESRAVDQGGPGGGWLQAPQLAMAAAALLVIGIGIATNFEFGTSTEDLPREAASMPAAPAQEQEQVRVAVESVAKVDKEAPPTVQKLKRPAAKRARQVAVASKKADDSALLSSGEVEVDEAKGASPHGIAAPADLAQASEALEDRAPSSSDANTLLRAANRLRDRQDCQRAVMVYERFLRESPTHSDASRAKLDAGRCYRELGQEPRARYWLTQAAKDKAVAAAARRELSMMDAAGRARDSNVEAVEEPAAAGDAR